MVRLRLVVGVGTDDEPVDFHSTMVRLRLFFGCGCGLGWGDFHSTMVRLRLNAISHSIEPIRCHFHSTMVRLRRKPPSLRSARKLDFHSTMVRLRQFRLHGCDDDSRISIPLWFDWDTRRKTSPIRMSADTISIPLWFDWDFFWCASALLFPEISIPLWFDWDLCDWPSDHPGHIEFPFHYGSIETGHEQFNISFYQISIPLWFDWDPIFTLLFFFIFIFYS